MKKVLNEIGFKKALRYVYFSIWSVLFNLLLVSPLRVGFLRLCGSKIGRNCVIHNIKFINLYRGSFSNLIVGDYCFIGEETMIDLADKVILGNHVTIAERVIILTHMNVGYKEHPLQAHYPEMHKQVIVADGVFIGAGVIVLAGIKMNEKVFVAAGALVNVSLLSSGVYGGVPVKKVKELPVEQITDFDNKKYD